jgi:hypothetical protein
MQPVMFSRLLLGVSSDPLKVEDQIKKSFITPFGTFCYTTMPFRLKSVGATYHRGIQKCIHHQLRRNAEAYMDDIVVQTWKLEDFISDLAETFNSLRKFSMKLNPQKYMFNVPPGNIIGYMVSHRGIDPNLAKISTIMNMNPPESLHDVQKLTWCMTTLHRFISGHGVRWLPFSSCLRGKMSQPKILI